MSRGAAARLLARVVRASGVSSPASPHALRRTFCTAGLISGVPLRDMQYAMRHADARTTMRYDMARANLDRQAAHSVAAYLAGMAVG
jgi:site-specific recombinase XerD